MPNGTYGVVGGRRLVTASYPIAHVQQADRSRGKHKDALVCRASFHLAFFGIEKALQDEPARLGIYFADYIITRVQ